MKKYDWETPQNLFDSLNDEFHFTLDVCANEQNAKCKKYYTLSDDGLSQDWSGEICWMNPPYGRFIANWMHKAYSESRNGATVVCLIPSRTDTRWWHSFVMKASEIRYLIKFFGGKYNAPFPSAVVIFKDVNKLSRRAR